MANIVFKTTLAKTYATPTAQLGTDFWKFSASDSVNAVYVPSYVSGMRLFYNDSSTVNLFTNDTDIELTSKYHTFTADNMQSFAIGTGSTATSINPNIDFYLFDDSTAFELETTDNSYPSNLAITKEAINGASYTLFNGSRVSYTPFFKHTISMQFAHIDAAKYQDILTNFHKPVLINPEPDNNDFSPTDFEQQHFLCSWKDMNLNLSYASQYKGAGYRGSITWTEI